MQTSRAAVQVGSASATSVREGRDRYLAENGFSSAGYEARWLTVTVLGIPLPTPYTRRRRWAMKMHDLHHVATGFATDLAGEGEISAWELRRGVRELGMYVGAIVVAGALLGVLVAPRRTLRAFQAAQGSRTSLYRTAHSYEALLAMSIGALRRELGLSQTGVAAGACDTVST